MKAGDAAHLEVENMHCADAALLAWILAACQGQMLHRHHHYYRSGGHPLQIMPACSHALWLQYR